MADVHLALLIVISREGREFDRLTVKRAQVDQAGCLSAAEVWNCDQKNFLTTRTWWKEESRYKKYLLLLKLPEIVFRQEVYVYVLLS